MVDRILIKVEVSVPKLAPSVSGCRVCLEMTWELNKNQLKHQLSASATTFTQVLCLAPLIFCHNLLGNNIYQLGKQTEIGEGAKPAGTATHKCLAHLEKKTRHKWNLEKTLDIISRAGSWPLFKKNNMHFHNQLFNNSKLLYPLRGWLWEEMGCNTKLPLNVSLYHGKQKHSVVV